MAAPSRPDTDERACPTLYLVFAGRHSENRRGAGDLVAVSASHDEAREAFRAVRLGLADEDGWAELTAVSDGGKTRRLSWFGTERWSRPNPLAGLVRSHHGAAPEPRGWRRRARRRG